MTSEALASVPLRLANTIKKKTDQQIAYVQTKDPLNNDDVDYLINHVFSSENCSITSVVLTVADATCFKKIASFRPMKKWTVFSVLSCHAIDDECLAMVINEIETNDTLQVLELSLSENLSEDVLIRLFVAATSSSSRNGVLVVVTIVNPYGHDLGGWRSFSPKVCQAYADFLLLPKKNVSDLPPSTTILTKDALALKQFMCSYLIKNERVIKDCLVKQRSILSAIVGSNDVDIDRLVSDLAATAKAEQLRLGMLTSDLVSSYALPYGHCFITSLHKYEPTEQYVSSSALRRYHSKPSMLVKAMLGTATWMENTFRSLLNSVATNLNQAADMPNLVELLSAESKDSFKRACVNEKAIRITNESIADSAPTVYSNPFAVDLDGDYAPVGMMNGDVAFFEWSKKLYLYKVSPKFPAWIISESLGSVSTSSTIFYSNDFKLKSILDVNPSSVLEFTDAFRTSFDPPIKVNMAFIDRVSYLYEQSLTAIKPDVLRCEVIHGPAKSFDRAAEKAQALGDKKLILDTLKDLNRATITSHSSISLACAFHLLEAELTKIGGRFSKIKNKFDDADADGRFPQPPNLHCFLKIPIKQEAATAPISSVDGLCDAKGDLNAFWVCEVQFTYADVLRVKAEQHLYYELERQVEDPGNLAIPVFKM